jgi:hypothetical protein
MNKYTPDLWVIASINSTEHGRIDKVVGSWFGGFAGSNSWKMSSGITKVVDQGDYYDVHNASGSIYKCYKNSEGASSYTGMVINSYATQIEEMGDGSSLRMISIDKVVPITQW